MPRPVGYGRPGTKVIPDGWEAAHARVVEDTFDCTVTVGPAGVTPAWNEERKQTETTAAAAVYAGPASITPVEQDTGGQTVTAEDVIPMSVYQVKLLHAADGVEVGHIVTVTEAPDSMLVDRLKVVAVEKSSRRFSRILQAVDAD